MWTVIVYAALYIGTWILNRYLSKSQAAPPKSTFDTVAFPRAEEAVPLPIFWGRVRIRSPTVIFARVFDGVERRQEINGDDVVVGYDYRLAVQLLLGTPGNREGGQPPSSLKQIWCGERQVWSGSVSDPDDMRYVNRPQLMGGPGGGGGVEGYVTYLPGSFTQTNNDFLKHLLQIADADVDVAYRGQAVVTLLGVRNKNVPEAWDFGRPQSDGGATPGSNLATHLDLVEARGWKFGEAPQLDGYSAEVEARCTTTSLGAALGLIGQDANPINVLLDLVTNQWNRLGLSSGIIDHASWLSAGQAVAAEGNGFSLYVANANDARQVAQTVLAQINGAMFDDPGTGKVKIKLVRDDYSLGSLPSITPTTNGIRVTNYTSGNWNETFNQVRVVFTNRANAYNDGSVGAQDIANINASGGRVRSHKVDYPGCCTITNAEMLASRDLRALSLPLAKVELTADRTTCPLRPGDAFKLTWPKFDNMTDVVFRVVKFDQGKIGSEEVTLNCVQDVFAFDHKVFRLPIPRIPVPRIPFPSTERRTEEAGRWPAQQAQRAGRINDHELPRAIHMSIPRGISTTYHAEVTLDGDRVARDIEPQPYPSYASVQAAYARDLEPYDTTIGLYITGLVGDALMTATAQEIRVTGKNLVRVGDEVVAYEDFTLISGSGSTAVYRLNNVWRGLMDTVAAAHEVGERVWFMAKANGLVVSRVGRVGWKVGDVPLVRHVPQRQSVLNAPPFRTGTVETTDQLALAVITTPPRADDDDLINHDHENGAFAETVGSRVSLAYPPDDITVNGSKTPARLEEGGFTVSWTPRSRFSDLISRGDDSAEDVEPSTLFAAVVRSPYYAMAAQDGTYSRDLMTTGQTRDYTTTQIDDVMLGRAGFGVLDVGAESLTPIFPQGPDPSSPRVILQPSWQIPTIKLECPEWRNLVKDGRFASGTIADGTINPPLDGDGWKFLSGAPLVGSGASGLGGSGTYAYASTAAATTFQQVFSCAGYAAVGLGVELHFYDKNITGAGSATVKGTISVLDADGFVIATANSGTLSPSSSVWNHRSVTIDDVRVTTSPVGNFARYPYQILVEFDLGSHGGTAVTEVVVRVGQFASSGGSRQLLANPDFESGTTGWTNVTNSFVTDTAAPLYVSAHYARGGNFANSEIKQQITVPAGWTESAVALIDLARANYSTKLDTGEVILEALDGGGGVLASATTGAETITPASTWVRRRVALSVPEGTVTVRARLACVRASGTTCDAAFDDLDFRIHKKLASSYEETAEFSVPSSQPLPASLDYWDRAWPTVTPPDLAMWSGMSAGALAIEPELTVDEDSGSVNPATFGAKFVGAYDATAGGAVKTSCFDFSPGCDGPLHAHSSTFASFTSASAFTILVFFRIGEENAGTALALCSRLDGTTGYSLTVDASGHLTATLYGSAGTVVAAGTRFVADRAIHAVAMIYDPVAAELRLVDEDGEVTSSTSAMGEIESDDPSLTFVIGDAPGIGVLSDSQVARVYMWEDAVATADLQLTMTHGRSPSAMLAATRTAGVLCCVVGEDSDGVLVSRYDQHQYAVGYSAALVQAAVTTPVPVAAETGRGLVSTRAVTNAVGAADQAQATGDWHTVGAAVTVNSGAGPEGNTNAVEVVGDNTQRRELRGIAASASADKLVAFFARTSTPLATKRFELANASDVVKGTHDFSATTEWALYWAHFSTWDASTPTCRLRWCGSSTFASSDVEIAGPFLLCDEVEMPGAIPIGSGGYTDCVVTIAAPAELNYEGEVEVQAVSTAGTPVDGSSIARADGGTNDERTMYIDASGKLKMDHYDGAGHVTAATAAQSDWDQAWVARGRWNTAGLTDLAGKYTSVVRGDDLSDPIGYGRTATWTPTSTPATQVQVGTTDFGDPMNGIIRRVVVRSREERLL